MSITDTFEISSRIHMIFDVFSGEKYVALFDYVAQYEDELSFSVRIDLFCIELSLTFSV